MAEEGGLLLIQAGGNFNNIPPSSFIVAGESVSL